MKLLLSLCSSTLICCGLASANDSNGIDQELVEAVTARVLESFGVPDYDPADDPNRLGPYKDKNNNYLPGRFIAAFTGKECPKGSYEMLIGSESTYLRSATKLERELQSEVRGHQKLLLSENHLPQHEHGLPTRSSHSTNGPPQKAVKLEPVGHDNRRHDEESTWTKMGTADVVDYQPRYIEVVWCKFELANWPNWPEKNAPIPDSSSLTNSP